jgi:hypothetical protein
VHLTTGGNDRILVLAADSLLAALIGQVIEATRLRVEFPKAGERPEDALTRIRPLAAILLDAVTDEAESDLFLARARRGGVAVYIFGSAAQVRRRSAWARMRDVPTFALPAQLDELSAQLERLREPVKAPRGESTRRARTLERTEDGVLIFRDSTGKSWSIYDRRIDRRRAVVDRRFVAEDGEVRRCDISVDESKSDTAEAIARQFERATADAFDLK